MGQPTRGQVSICCAPPRRPPRPHRPKSREAVALGCSFEECSGTKKRSDLSDAPQEVFGVSQGGIFGVFLRAKLPWIGVF